MGTSQSSKGPLGGVPMVPPWVPEFPDPTPPTPPPTDVSDDDVTTASPSVAPASIPAQPSPIATSGRFAGASRNLRKFAGDGDKRAMRRGVGQYFKSGYGGGATAVRRFGGTAQAAAGLFGALAPAGNPATGSPLDHSVLGSIDIQGFRRGMGL